MTGKKTQLTLDLAIVNAPLPRTTGRKWGAAMCHMLSRGPKYLRTPSGVVNALSYNYMTISFATDDVLHV